MLVDASALGDLIICLSMLLGAWCGYCWVTMCSFCPALVCACISCCREEEGGFNTRPPPWEVRQRVDRRRDRTIKLEAGKAAAAEGDK